MLIEEIAMPGLGGNGEDVLAVAGFELVQLLVFHKLDAHIQHAARLEEKAELILSIGRSHQVRRKVLPAEAVFIFHAAGRNEIAKHSHHMAEIKGYLLSCHFDLTALAALQITRHQKVKTGVLLALVVRQIGVGLFNHSLKTVTIANGQALIVRIIGKITLAQGKFVPERVIGSVVIRTPALENRPNAAAVIVKA